MDDGRESRGPGIARRELLRGGARAGLAALAAWLLGGTREAAARTARGRRSSGGEPLFRISLAEWSLHRALGSGEVDPLDFPRTAREDYGIEAVEYVSTFLAAGAQDPAWIGSLDRRCRDAGVRSLLIMVDGEGVLGAAEEAVRIESVERHKKWVEAGRRLGCHSIRVNAHGEGSREEQLDRVADGLRRLAEFAAGLDCNVLIENHGGLSSDGSWVAALMRRVDHPRCGTLPDFGNFSMGSGEAYDRYRGVAEMMPWAHAVSAKSHDFDEEGNEVHTDYRRMLRIVLDAGYHGHLGIEYEGSGLSEPEGIRATKRLLERVRGELEAERGGEEVERGGEEADQGDRDAEEDSGAAGDGE